MKSSVSSISVGSFSERLVRVDVEIECCGEMRTEQVEGRCEADVDFRMKDSALEHVGGQSDIVFFPERIGREKDEPILSLVCRTACA
ncbi:MAG: hypothetical protein QM784_19135 [Polyangiaceae bacterium]